VALDFRSAAAILLLGVLCACTGAGGNCPRAPSVQGHIERDALVRCAEEYVRDNGFTDAPPNLSRVQLDVNDMIEGDTVRRLPLVLAQRKDSVEPLAASACPGAMFSVDGVIVIFRPKKGPRDKGLGVTVERGCRPRIAHLPAPLFESYQVSTGCDAVHRADSSTARQ
jgi:hypothetical protein